MKRMGYLVSALIVALCSVNAAAQGGEGVAVPDKPKSAPKAAPAAPTRAPRSTPAKPPVARAVPAPRVVTTANLTVNAYQPGATVLVNGRARGVTGSDGLLNVSSLKPGQYVFTVRKPNYIEQQRSVTIFPGQSLVLETPLRGLPGRLSVMPSVADATIEISGAGSYQNQVSNLELGAGTYEVKVSKSGYRTATQSVVININSPTSVNIPLAAITVEEMLSEATAYFAARQYNRALEASDAALAKQPDHARANLLAGLSYFYSAQYPASVRHLQKAMAGGEMIELPVKHHHRVLLADRLCTGILRIGRGMLSFKSLNGKDDESFIVLANKILEIKPEPNKAGRIHLEVLIQKEGKKKEDKKTYNFHTSHTITRRLRPEDASSSEFVHCDGCQPEMQAVYELLMHLKGAATTTKTE